MELHLGEDVPYARAVCQWYDDLYQPLVDMIRARNLLKDFPNRTEGDFFVWLLDHQARLTKETGWHIRMDAALRDLTEKIYTEAESLTARVRNTVLSALPLVRPTPPVTGQWRDDHKHRPGRMFSEILVPLQGKPPWLTLECALQIAGHEHAQVYGIHFASRHLSPEAQAEVQDQYETLCQKTGVEGRLVFEKGKANVILPARSRWVDLVVSPLIDRTSDRDSRNPSGSLPLSYRPLLQHCHTPFLALPGPFTFPTRALLAYDGSKKADEALFMAAYLASFWGLELVIFSVLPTEAGQATRPDMDYAQTYLRRYYIDAPVCYVHGETTSEILRAAQEYACDLILMGGYGEIPLFGGFRKRTVDAVLARTDVPVLICR